MEKMLDYVRRRLRDEGSAEWPAILEQTGVKKTIPRKITYGIKGATLDSVEPMYRYFLRKDFGVLHLPHEPAPAKRSRVKA